MNCIYCGASNSDEAVFCQKCGKQLELTALSIPTSITPPNLPISTYESTEYAPSEPSIPPPPFITHYGGGSNPYEQQASPRSHTNRGYRIVIATLVIMLITAGVLVGILIEKGNTLVTTNNTSNTPNQAGTIPANSNSTATAIPATATPSPTPASPQPGTVLYQANWSGGLNDWTGTSDWKTSNGMLISDGSYNDPNNYGSPTIEPSYQVKETSDYAVEVRIQQLGGAGCFDAAVIRGSIASDGVQGYRLAIGCFGGATLYAAHGSSLNQLAHVDFDPGNTWHTYRLEAKGTSISAFIDGIQVFGVNDATYLSGGIIGIKSQATQIDVSSFMVIAV